MNEFSSLQNLEKEGNIIRCPFCGQEYLPAEIFLAEDILGAPKDIVKTPDGKIDFHFGEQPTLEAEYCCDACNTTFITKVRLAFESIIDTDFDTEYVSKLKRNIFTNEVDLFNDNTTEEE